MKLTEPRAPSSVASSTARRSLILSPPSATTLPAADLRQVMWSMTTRVHAGRDVTLIPNTRVHALDPASPSVPGAAFQKLGTKWMIDATKPAIAQEEERARFTRAMPKNFDEVDIAAFLPDEVFD